MTIAPNLHRIVAASDPERQRRSVAKPNVVPSLRDYVGKPAVKIHNPNGVA